MENGETGSPKGRKELEAIFRSWDERKLDISPDLLPDDGDIDEFYAPDPTVWRGLFMLVVIASAAFIMSKTTKPFLYWFNSLDGAVNLGDLRTPWKAGEKLTLPDNRYVKVSGLFATYKMTGTLPTTGEEGCTSDSDCPSEAFCAARGSTTSNTPWTKAAGPEGVCALKNSKPKNYYLDPLFNIIVQTDRPFPPSKGHRSYSVVIDPAYAKLIQGRKAVPVDLTTTLVAKGRLLSYAQATKGARNIILQYAGQVETKPSTFHILIDGDDPDGYEKFAWIWGGCLFAPLIPILLFIRAFVRRRRRLASL